MNLSAPCHREGSFMPDPDPTNPPQLPPEEEGGFRVKVLLGGIVVLFVLICILIGVLVATRERGVNRKAETPSRIHRPVASWRIVWHR
jgi:hypothetical protein